MQEKLNTSNTLPKMWKRKNLLPFNTNGTNGIRSVHVILLFQGRRAVFLTKEYSHIGTFATRDTKILLAEAETKNWIKDSITDYEFGPRPESYPKKAYKAYWISL